MKAQPILLLLTDGLLMSACQPQANIATPTDVHPVRTDAARTVEALSTQIVATDQAARTQTATALCFASAANPGANSAPTLSLPTDPPVPLPPCCPRLRGPQAATRPFSDETIPDGSHPPNWFHQDLTFTYTGLHLNADYDVVFTSGNRMNAPEVVPLSANQFPRR